MKIKSMLLASFILITGLSNLQAVMVSPKNLGFSNDTQAIRFAEDMQNLAGYYGFSQEIVSKGTPAELGETYKNAQGFIDKYKSFDEELLRLGDSASEKGGNAFFGRMLRYEARMRYNAEQLDARMLLKNKDFDSIKTKVDRAIKDTPDTIKRFQTVFDKFKEIQQKKS